MIGKNLYEYRMKACLKQKEAAEKMGIKSSRLSAYETGAVDPPIPILRKMVEVYGVTADQLIKEA